METVLSSEYLDSLYFDIRMLVPYQRNFIFVNGERSIGKSYGTQKFLISQALKRGKEFVFLVRTQNEKKNGIMEDSFKKVLAKEFPDERIECTTEEMKSVYELEDGVKVETVLGYCLAMSEYVQIKKRSFPNVFYILMDEYMIEKGGTSSYYQGWKEPDILLNIYHTIDREEDRVMCILLGNNTTFYNPYHLHPAFNIPQVKQGGLWMNENVLFYWGRGSESLKEEKSKSKFVKMIQPTEYSKYAIEGEYIEDNNEFIEERTDKAYHSFTISGFDETFGIWIDSSVGKIFISRKFDPSNPVHLSLTVENHKENTMLTRNKNNTFLKHLSSNFKLGNVRYENMEVKKRAENLIKLILYRC